MRDEGLHVGEFSVLVSVFREVETVRLSGVRFLERERVRLRASVLVR